MTLPNPSGSIFSAMPQPAVEPEHGNATVAVFGDLHHAEEAVRALERGGFDMTHLSIMARGESTERHVIGFDDKAHRERAWASWGGLWGALFASFFFIPGIGSVALGGYVVYLLVAGAVGAGVGALSGALSTMGLPDEAIIRYETALRAEKQVLVASGSEAQVEHARELLRESRAESVELHRPLEDWRGLEV
jgi:uncharacterized membrane protein